MNKNNTNVNHNNNYGIKSISVDTLFRKNYDRTKSSDFIYTLPETINKVVSMKISAIELPNMWYTISEEDHTNEFTISVFNFYENQTDSNGNTAKTFVNSRKHVIKLPDGNYGVSTSLFSIQNTLNEYFSNIRGGLEFLLFDIDLNSTRTIFRARDTTDSGANPKPYDVLDPFYSPNFYFEIDFTIEFDTLRPLYKNIGWFFGFKNAKYTVTIENTRIIYTLPKKYRTITYYSYLQSEASYGNSIYQYIFLDVNDFHNNFTTDMMTSSLGPSYIGNNILARVTVSSTSTSIIFNNASDLIFKTREYFGPVKIEKLHIRVLNKFGDVINLNGNDYSFLIEFTVLNT